MEDHETQPSRRTFLKGAGAAALGALAASGIAGMTGCSSSSSSTSTTAGGVEKADADLYAEIFPSATRSLPVLDIETDMRRRGPIGFENREIAEREISSTIACDVLVIGCGITGSCAALSASDDGTTSVVCLEKMNVGRGMFEGMGTVGGTRMTEAGNVLDQAAVLDEVYRSAYYRIPAGPARVWVRRSGEAADWLQDRFDEGTQQIVTKYAAQKPYTNGFTFLQTELSFSSSQWSAQVTANAGGSGIYIVRDLANTLSQRANVDLRYNVAVVQLEQDADGRVTGAIAKDENDAYLRITARNGVILATGGYDANPDMLKAWCRSEDIANSASWCPHLGCTGDGHMMGLRVGATMDPIPHAVMNFNWGSPDAFYASGLGLSTPMSLGIMVNENGKRFCNESLPFQARGNAISGQRGYGESCWTVWDSSMLGTTPDTTRAAITKFEEKGWCFEGATLAELEEQIGVPSGYLSAEVERYNGFISAGKDNDFNKNVSSSMSLQTGPFYALTHQQSILATVSGLIVDEDTRVLDWEGNAIEGLFAAGNTSGGMFSGNYPRHIFGPSIGRCVTFGYVAGQNAAKGE
jgi:fumarate reductase flavoprotein subunit